MTEIIVVGSINSDTFLLQNRLTRIGETYIVRGVREDFGGKGANQAVQCAKLGAKVAFIGAVGADGRGDGCVANLAGHGIETHVSKLPGEATGIGVINVLPDGEVCTTVGLGANLAIEPELVWAEQELFTTASWLVVQNEIPPEVVAAAMQFAHANGVQVVYNAAPARPDTAYLMAEADYLIINEEETSALLDGVTFTLGHPSLVPLETLGPKVVLTLGSRGALAWFGEEWTTIDAVSADAIDTTGAGDSWVGAFTAALAAGSADLDAARRASAVAAETTKRVGAQAAMPSQWPG